MLSLFCKGKILYAENLFTSCTFSSGVYLCPKHAFSTFCRTCLVSVLTNRGVVIVLYIQLSSSTDNMRLRHEVRETRENLVFDHDQLIYKMDEHWRRRFYSKSDLTNNNPVIFCNLCRNLELTTFKQMDFCFRPQREVRETESRFHRRKRQMKWGRRKNYCEVRWWVQANEKVNWTIILAVILEGFIPCSGQPLTSCHFVSRWCEIWFAQSMHRQTLLSFFFFIYEFFCLKP